MDASELNSDRMVVDLDHVQSVLPSILRDSFNISHLPSLRLVEETAYPYSRMRVVEFETDSAQKVRLYLKRIVVPDAGAYVSERIVAREENFLLQLNKKMPHESVHLVAAFPEYGTTVTEECGGQSLGSIVHSSPYWGLRRSDSCRNEELYFLCGEWLQKFHNVSKQERSNLRPWYSYLSGEMIWRIKQLSEDLPKHEHLFKTCSQRYIDDLDSLNRNGTSHMYHGDFAPHNIFFGNETIRVIDFTSIKRGSGISDVINFLSSISPQPENFLPPRALFRRFCKAFLAGYGPISVPDPRISDLLLVLESVKRLFVLTDIQKNCGYMKSPACLKKCEFASFTSAILCGQQSKKYHLAWPVALSSLGKGFNSQSISHRMLPRVSDDLFRHRLDNIISLQHPLARLAERIDWEGMNNLLGEYYEEAVVGQPPKPTRLMAGLLYLKHTFALLDSFRFDGTANWLTVTLSTNR